MGRKSWIAVIAAALVVVLGAGGAYAYDSSQKDKIADGVTIAGVDVGGLDEEEAARAVRRQTAGAAAHSLEVSFDGDNWELPGAKLKVRAEVDKAVEGAVADSQDGGFPGRLVRYVTGGEVTRAFRRRSPTPSPRSTASSAASPTKSTAKPKNATVEASWESLEVVAGEYGRKLRDNRLTRDLERRGARTPMPRTRSSPRSTRPSRR